MKRFLSFLPIAALGATACTSVPPSPQRASAVLTDASGRVVARADLRQASHALAVHVEAAGLAAGTYGMHLHAVGRCEPPTFASAGSHWNPTAHQHGRDNPAGMHLGDLPNLVVGADGRGVIDFQVPSATLSGAGPAALLDADGAAIVVHAQADDYRTDPSGNSGTRIACGIVSAR